MSLQLILGGSGTGKSTRLYQMIVERSVQFPDEDAVDRAGTEDHAGTEEYCYASSAAWCDECRCTEF